MAEVIEILDGDNNAADSSVRRRAVQPVEHPRRINLRFSWLRGVFHRGPRRTKDETHNSAESECLQNGSSNDNGAEMACDGSQRINRECRSRRKKKRSKSSNLEESEFQCNGRLTNQQNNRISWSSFKKSIRRLRNRSPASSNCCNESNITVNVDGQRLEDSPVLQRSNQNATASSNSTGSNRHDSGCLKSLLEKKEEYCIPRKICKVINCPWYWGNIDRFEAASALQAKMDGYFLLRKSAHPDFLFTISFKRFNTTMHVRIESGYDNQETQEKEEENFTLPWTEPGIFSPTYSRLVELVDMCCKPYEGSIYNMPLLVSPLKRNHPLSLKDLARAQVYNICNYSSIESLHIPAELKLYVKEYRFKTRNATNLGSLAT